MRALVGWNRTAVDRSKIGLKAHATVVRAGHRLRLVPGAVRTRPAPLPTAVSVDVTARTAQLPSTSDTQGAGTC